MAENKGYIVKFVISFLRKFKINYKYLIMMLIALVVIALLYIICKKRKRYRKIEDLPKNCTALVLKGVVTRVCDGDGFYFYHTDKKSCSKHQKGLYVRIAGIDAPEVRKYGTPAQPFAKESKQFLVDLILKKTVTITILGIDLYNRVLAEVYIETKNVGLESVKNGYACVYVGKNAVYGSIKNKLLKYEKNAKVKKLNMWSDHRHITPMEYKRNNR